MAIRHGVTDSDNHFVIDPVTRTIKNNSGKTVLIQHDHNSERFTFECPRYVDEHDMSLCDSIEIHYINTGTGSYQSSGIYEAEDLKLAADGTDNVTFTWLISRNATQHVGKLNFVVRFVCVGTESVLEYAWNTAIYSDITIAKSIYNGDQFVEDYVDLLEQWKMDLYSAGLKIVDITQHDEPTDDGGVKIIEMEMTDGSRKLFQIRNGSPGATIESVERVTDDFCHLHMSDGRIISLELKNGVGIDDIAKTFGDSSPGSTDLYEIRLTNGELKTFEVYNGKDGETVTVTGVTALSNNPGTLNTYRMNFSDDTNQTFEIYNGKDGVGISSVTRTSGNGAPGTYDIYTITFTNKNTATFRVYNGKDGADGDGSGDMVAATYDPQAKHADIFAYADTAKTLIVTVTAGTDGGLTADYKSTQVRDHVLNGGSAYALYENNLYTYSRHNSSYAYFIGIQTYDSDNSMHILSLSVDSAGTVTRKIIYFNPDEHVKTANISDSVTETAYNKIASSKAVKIAYDKAVEAYNKAGSNSGSGGADILVVSTSYGDNGEVVPSHSSSEIKTHLSNGGTTILRDVDAGYIPLAWCAGDLVVYGSAVPGDNGLTYYYALIQGTAITQMSTNGTGSGSGSAPLVITLTENDDGTLTPSYTAAEIIQHLESGGVSYVIHDGLNMLLPLMTFTDEGLLLYGATLFEDATVAQVLVQIEGDTAFAFQYDLDIGNYVRQNLMSDSVSMNASDMIASSKAVKIAYDKAVEAYDKAGNSGSGGSVTVDTALSETSTNPVQNKVVTAALDGKQPKTVSVEIVETICEDITFDDSHPTYTLPKAITLDEDAFYYIDCRYYTDSIEDGLYKKYCLYTFSKLSSGVVQWATANEYKAITLNGTSITNNWRDDGHINVISIYKVNISQIDPLILAALHSTGYKTVAPGAYNANAEGHKNIALGYAAHAEGRENYAYGDYSHAEGAYNETNGHASHVEGYGNVSASNYQHVEGKFNVEDAEGVYAHIVGNGESNAVRSNAHTLDWSGNAWFGGNVMGKQANVTEQLEANNGTNKISIWPNGIAGDPKEGTDESKLWIGSDGHGHFTNLYICTGDTEKEVATKDDITAAITGAIEGSY